MGDFGEAVSRDAVRWSVQLLGAGGGQAVPAAGGHIGDDESGSVQCGGTDWRGIADAKMALGVVAGLMRGFGCGLLKVASFVWHWTCAGCSGFGIGLAVIGPLWIST